MSKTTEWCCAVYSRNGKEFETIFPLKWIVGDKVLFPTDQNTRSKAIAKDLPPGSNWCPYELVKIKCQGERQTCDDFNFATTEDEATSKDNCSNTKKRNKKKAKDSEPSSDERGSSSSNDDDNVDNGNDNTRIACVNNSISIPTARSPSKKLRKQAASRKSPRKSPRSNYSVPPVPVFHGVTAAPNESASSCKYYSEAPRKSPRLNKAYQAPEESPSRSENYPASPVYDFSNNNSAPRRSPIFSNRYADNNITHQSSPQRVLTVSGENNVTKQRPPARLGENNVTRQRPPARVLPMGGENNNVARRSVFPMTVERFQRQVLGSLTRISTSIEQLGNRYEPENSIFHLEKLDSLESFVAFEEDLESEQNKKLAIRRLSTIGGTNAADCTRNIMRSLMTYTVMSKFNMNGNRGKEKFRPTKTLKLIIDAVKKMYVNATDDEIYKVVQLTLKHAPAKKAD